MPKILALSSSTDHCSVAICTAEDLFFEQNTTPRAHAQEILPMVERVLEVANTDLNAIDAIAFDKGPGSFTGLRICMSLAQGLAFGAEKVLVGVSSLEAMANASFDARENTLVVSVLDARMGEVYWAAYEKNQNKGVQVIQAPIISEIKVSQAEISKLVDATLCSNISIVGPGVSCLDNSVFAGRGQLSESERPDARWVARLGLRQWQAGDFIEPERAELLYLRNSVSWNKRKKIRNP